MPPLAFGGGFCVEIGRTKIGGVRQENERVFEKSKANTYLVILRMVNFPVVRGIVPLFETICKGAP